MNFVVMEILLMKTFTKDPVEPDFIAAGMLMFPLRNQNYSDLKIAIPYMRRQLLYRL